MFKNLLKHHLPSIAAAAEEPDGRPGGAPPPTNDASGISADEMQAWRDRILGAGSDDAALLRLAHQAPSVDLKLAALESLTQEDSFKQAMREFGDQDKRLYRAAKARWQTAKGKREAATEAEALIASARGLLEQELIPVNRVVELDRTWAALNVELLDPGLPAEYARLSAQLGERVRARGEAEQAITRWLAATENATNRLKATLTGVAQGDIPPAESENLAARLLELLGSVPDTADSRCIEKTEAANRALALASSVVQRAGVLQSLPAPGIADEATEKAKIEEWRGIPEVAEAELQSILASRFADWRNASGRERQHIQEARRADQQKLNAQEKKLRLNAIQHDVEAAEAAHAAGHVADLTRLLTGIDHALKSGPVDAALTQRIESLRREQSRLRDWQRWSGKQRREELVAEADALARAASAKVAVKAHAEAIDKLRQRWKDLDKLGGATNQTLWLAFDGALKTAYAPVAAHLEKLKVARNENLAARNQIIDRLVQAAAKYFPVPQEGGATTSEVRPDWRGIARTLEEAQIAWRKLGPVEHTVPREAQRGDKAVTARYAKAGQALEAPLKAAYEGATREREQLIGAAKALVGTGTAARDLVDKVRKLQTQWQATAKNLPLPRREENALWTAFKTATDEIFTTLDAARAAREAEFATRTKAREDIIERLTALAAASTASDIKHGVAEAESAWRAAPEMPKPMAAKLEARYRAARDAATRRIGELAVHASQARFDALIAAMALCHERETAGEAAADFDARWSAIEHLPDAWKARLEVRFRGANTEVSDPVRQKAEGKPTESWPDALLNLEVACGIDSPPEFLAARQQLKLRALKNAMETRRDTTTTPADIERWLLDAAATPRPDELSRERLAKIIAAVRVRQTGRRS